MEVQFTSLNNTLSFFRTGSIEFPIPPISRIQIQPVLTAINRIIVTTFSNPPSQIVIPSQDYDIEGETLKINFKNLDLTFLQDFAIFWA